MSDTSGDFVVACQSDDFTSHTAFSKQDTDVDKLMAGASRAWFGDVFFDHLRGVIDPAPVPMCEPGPFILVTYFRDWDWTAQHACQVAEFSDAAALIAEARGAVDSERSSGSSNYELWEVYGVRVRKRIPLGSPARP
jgi:hypothetical protein